MRSRAAFDTELTDVELHLPEGVDAHYHNVAILFGEYGALTWRG
jgi:hypothetical protein